MEADGHPDSDREGAMAHASWAVHTHLPRL
jgi:hypothetical protein